MSELIKGFQTIEGIKKYDYEALENKPDLDLFLKTTETSAIPAPGKLLYLNKNAELPVNITGNSATAKRAEIATTAEEIEWTNIQNKPSSLEEYGLSEEVYTKDQIQEYTYDKETIDELLENLSISGDSGFATALNNHNESQEAHLFLQELILALSNKLNNILDVNDETLNSFSDLINYMNEIKDSKVNIIDIVDNLITNSADRPLSAAQGVVLKQLIEAIKVPTQLSELQQDDSHLTVTLEEKQNWNTPKIEVDSSLTQEGMAADAKAVGERIGAIKIPTQLSELQQDNEHLTVTLEEKQNWNTPKIELDSTLSQSGQAADALAVGEKIEDVKTNFQNNEPTKIQGLWVDLDDETVDGSFIDETLTQEGMAADARVVGNRFNNLSIPSKLSDLEDDASHRTITDAEKEKLAGVEAEANKIIVDDSLSSTSTNPVQNKIIESAISSKQDKIQPIIINVRADNWKSDNTQIVIVDEATSDNIIISSPSPASFQAYNEAGVYCSVQTLGALVFACETIPTVDLEVYLLIFN